MKSLYPLITIVPTCLKRILFFFTCLLFLNQSNGQATDDIFGIVNSYYKVNEMVPAKSGVIVDDPTGLVHGNMVMIVQMKGATINTSTGSGYGVISSMNNAGNYEIATVCSVVDDTVFFFHNLINSYTESGKIQLVKFAEYYSARVIDTVKALSWSDATGTGGVIAIRVDEDLTLQKPIYGDSSGFEGGAFFQHSGNCPAGSSYAMDADNFSATNNGAHKGECIADISSTLDGGKGAPANGGGGGNNHNNSGGGGSNLSAGGNGGGISSSTPLTCLSTNNYGRGGAALNSSGGTRIFLGGGGGAGHTNGNVFTNDAGNGGAIIFIWATTLNGGGQTISANGGSGRASLSDGAGGGGAGGTIIMNVTNYSGMLTISANGGNGGKSDDDALSGRCFGGGGGGSGGVVYFTGTIPGGSVTTTVDGGAGGVEVNRSGTCNTAVPAVPGNTGISSGSYSFTRSTDPAGYCALLLPSKLISFTAGISNSNVGLHWRILYPEFVSEFIIERKSAAGQWMTWKRESAMNNKEDYSLTDNDPLPATSFYRLKIMETSGSFYYSDIRMINIDAPIQAFTVYPNPAHGSITIIRENSTPVEMRLLHLSGKTILQKSIHVIRTEINLPELNAGIYIIRIGQSVRKLVIH